MRKGTTDRGQETDDSGDENGATTSEVVVDRIGTPAAEESRADVRTGVDETDEPLVVLAKSRLDIRADGYAEFRGEGQIGAVRARLVPASAGHGQQGRRGEGARQISLLDGGTDGADDDGDVKPHGLLPFVQELHLQDVLLLRAQLLEALVTGRVLGNQSSLLEIGDDLGETILGREVVDVSEKHISGYIRERVRDPEGGRQQSRARSSSAEREGARTWRRCFCSG